MASVGIVGAGISGLTAAYRFHQAGVTPTVFERDGRPGGVIYSERFDAPDAEGTYLVEFGPNSLRASTPLLDELFADLDLEQDRVEADAAARRRYVAFSGRPVALPSSLRGLLSTELFSPQAKLRLLAEPLARPAQKEESVAAFARRRLGTEVLNYGLNPFTAGVFAGDPEQLSLRHAFPRIYEMEQRGSLLGGALKQAAERFMRRLFANAALDEPERSGLFSLRNGLETLPRALADRLGPDGVRYNTAVRSLRRTEDRWHVHTRRDGQDEEHSFDAVVWAAPLHVLLQIAPQFEAGLSPFEEVSYPPVSVVATGFERAAVDHPLDGFGMLVPAAEEGCQTLGTLFSSTVFPDRAPRGHVLLTTFVGGTRKPELANASDSEVYEAVLHDLRPLLGAHDPPSFRRRVHWPCAIPQYHVGYGRIKDHIEQLEADHPDLALAGNYRAGISVGDAAASGDAAARRLTGHLQ